MLTSIPAAVDPDIAAAVFAEHVARVAVSDQARIANWRITRLDPLHVVVTITGRRRTGGDDEYHVKLGAEYYDLHPPTTSFVCPPPADAQGWAEAPAGSRWLPNVSGLPWLAIHSPYPSFVDGRSRQLVCCSMTFEYYITGHAPTPGQTWRQGRHTLAATLNRLQAALDSEYYQGPAGALDS